MLTKIRVFTSLLMVLLMFGLLQAFSGSIFYSALSYDKQSFAMSQLAMKNTQALNDAYMSLNQSPEPGITDPYSAVFCHQ